MITESPLIKKIENNSGYSTIELVSIVADKLAEYLLKILKKQDKILIICGIGNNGADGLALAGLLNKDYKTKVYLIADELKTEAANHYYSKLDKNMIIDHISNDYDIIIDCIYGFSFHGSIKAEQRSLFNTINNLDGYKISIDINSGCEADSAICDSYAIKSDLTLALAYLKPFHLFQKEHMMFKELAIIELPLSTNEKSNYYEMDEERFIKQYPFIPENGYKGINGKSFIIAGSYGMAGAAILSTKACLRSGIGKVCVRTPMLNYQIMQISVPEAVLLMDNDEKVFSESTDANDYEAVAIGPGLGQAENTAVALMAQLKRTQCPIVADADALNILSSHQAWMQQLPRHIIMTPHLKEMDRLIGNACNGDYERLTKACEMAARHEAYIILKGHHTAICTPEGRVFFNNTGNSGMATAGSGDVLTGIITGLLGRGYSEQEACILGVYLHGLAGDIAVRELGKESLIASDIIDYLPKAFKLLEE